jgi:hypothetical protein
MKDNLDRDHRAQERVTAVCSGRSGGQRNQCNMLRSTNIQFFSLPGKFGSGHLNSLVLKGAAIPGAQLIVMALFIALGIFGRKEVPP